MSQEQGSAGRGFVNLEKKMDIIYQKSGWLKW